MSVVSAILASKCAFERVGLLPPSTIWIDGEAGEALMREIAPTMKGPATIGTALALGSATIAGIRVRWPVTEEKKKAPLAGRGV